MSNYNSVSSYWLDDDYGYDYLDQEAKKAARKDPIKLNAYRNAVSNFVRIVTGEPIRVVFEGKGASYTDGKTVTIGASLKEKDFDPAVGLALHEGSHCKLTNFDVLSALGDFIQKHDEECNMISEKYDLPERWDATYYIQEKLKDLLNIVEDRRIDNYVYNAAPGYRGYYQALYDKYFNSRIIDKGLISDEYTDENWESYMFRVINITNSNRRLGALKGLKDVWKILDLKHVSRLTSTEEALEVAWSIFKVIENNIPKPEQEVESSNQKGEGGDDECECSGGDINGGEEKECKTPEGEAPKDDGSTAEGGEAKKESGNKKGNAKAPELLSDSQKRQLQNAIQKQKKFNKGELKKTSVNKKLNKLLDVMEKAGVEEREVEFENDWNFKKKQKVTVIKDFNKALTDNVYCCMYGNTKYSAYGCMVDAVNKGLQSGTILGKKLKVRAEERSTKFNRQRTGKIDKRMLHTAGFGIESIFQKVESFSFTPGMVHISIDNSGSMNGKKMLKSVTTAVAIAKACSMIENMDCVISYRAAGSVADSCDVPIMLIAYDSRKHGLNQIKTMMPYVQTAGTTPEGLCFDAVMKEIVESSIGKDAYFINFSDGMPYYNGYSGRPAYNHTRKQVKKMRYEGIKVISYYITGGYGSDISTFQSMYGKDASNINVENVSEVARTMNKKFLEVVK